MLVDAIMFDNISKFKFKFNIPNGCGCMPQESAPADPGWDEDPARRAAGMPTGPDQPVPPRGPVGAGWEPVITRPDPMTEEEREAWLDDLAEPFDPEEYPTLRGRRRRVRMS